MDKETIALLEKHRQSKYAFETIDKNEFLSLLMKNIGDPDPYVRDALIYPNLAHLLYDDHLEKSVLKDTAFLFASKDYLMFDMENQDPFSVLKRTYTSLQLVILLYVHRRDTVFSNEEFHRLFDTFSQYYSQESILKGHDETVGWMHSIAHGADVLVEFAKSVELTPEERKAIFSLAKEKFLVSSSTYICDEDERITSALVEVLEHGSIEDAFLETWTKEIVNAPDPKDFPAIYHFKNNRKNLLRSLFFRLKGKDNYVSFRGILENAIIQLENLHKNL